MVEPVIRIGLAAAVVADATVAAQPRPAATPRRGSSPIGDVHGSLDGLTSILKAAGLIDAGRRWTGGTATLVQTGDLTDRGARGARVLDLMMALEREAPKSQGHGRAGPRQPRGHEPARRFARRHAGDLRGLRRRRLGQDPRARLERVPRADRGPGPQPAQRDAARLHAYPGDVADGLCCRAASSTARPSVRAASTAGGCATGRSPCRSAAASSCTPARRPSPPPPWTSSTPRPSGDRALRSLPAAAGRRASWPGRGSASRTRWPSPRPRCAGRRRS